MNIKLEFSASPKNKNLFFLVDDFGSIDNSKNKIEGNFFENLKKISSNFRKENKFGEYFTSECEIEGKIHNCTILTIGKEETLNEYFLQKTGGEIYKLCSHLKLTEICLYLNLKENTLKEDFLLANIGLGFLLKSYKFTKYFTDEKKKEKFTSIEIIANEPNFVQEKFRQLLPIYNGVARARDVISEPANKLYPENYANICQEELTKLGVKVKILTEQEMRDLGMEAALGVAQGSSKSPKLVIMEYQAAEDKSAKPVIFVGKGVTFDSGGISIKPSENMDQMKYDMAGSAAVFGAIRVLAERKAKVNVVGAIILVENMPDGNAQRPGDIVKSMSGQTIEVLNTDAEGRLILADALHYCQTVFDPEIIVDLATLTGAVVVALSEVYAGLFSNDDELAEKLISSGQKTGEKLWRLPLSKEYDEMINSKIADMQNISNAKGGGSITAAQFLQRFIKKGVKWAHLDIAGVAWASKEKDLCQVGATGFGVRLLNNLVSENYEK